MNGRTLEAILYLIRKDFMVLRREPFYLIVSMIIPLFFFLLFSLISAGSATQPIAIARESQGQWSETLLEIMKARPGDRRSEEMPYWEVVSAEPQEARRLYHENRVMGLVTIPPSFDEDLAAGRKARVSVEVNNINSDYTKNLWFRMDHNIRELNTRIAGEVVAVKEEAWLPKDIRMLSYMAASLVVFAFFYGGMVNTASAVAREWDDGTAKELLLSPYGMWGVIGGKLLVGLAQTFVSGALVWLATWLVDDFVPRGPWWAVGSLLLVTALLGTAIGALAGVWLRRVLPAMQFCIVLSLTVFLLGSGISPLSGVAWGGITRAMYYLGLALPPTYAFEASHVLLNGGLLDGLGRTMLILGGSSLVTLGLASWALSRALRSAPRPVTT